MDAAPAPAASAKTPEPPPGSPRPKLAMMDVATGMPTSTRFVGKLMKEKAAAAATKRSAWRASVQKSKGSRDSVESPPQQMGSRKSPGTAGEGPWYEMQPPKSAYACNPAHSFLGQ